MNVAQSLVDIQVVLALWISFLFKILKKNLHKKSGIQFYLKIFEFYGLIVYFRNLNELCTPLIYGN